MSEEFCSTCKYHAKPNYTEPCVRCWGFINHPRWEPKEDTVTKNDIYGAEVNVESKNPAATEKFLTSLIESIVEKAVNEHGRTVTITANKDCNIKISIEPMKGGNSQ